ncbi:MAG: putative FAD-dependent oxidoreductase [Phycisphaerales bacterium]|nr:putative FAD-dependent oxidoreductase [Phycisphaerales bacterium]
MTQELRADIVIIGGGIMGLWARALLARAGYGVLLIEKSCLGDGQTIRSQGILHRGLKYGLSRAAREASDQLEDAVETWERALRGEGAVDLRRADVLSNHTCFWTVDGGLLAGLTAQIGTRLLKAESRSRELERGEFPPGFRGAPASVRVWSAAEPVLDAPSLLACVRDAGAGPVMLATVTFLGDHGSREGPQIEAQLHDGDSIRVAAGCVVLAAGEGNEHLLTMAGLDGPGASQRRPLQMGLVDHVPFELFGHVLRPGSDKPRITITTGRRDGTLVWYVGGDVAERGVDMNDDDFRALLAAEVAACVPWADLSRSRFSSLRVDRAEGRTEDGKRPAGPVVRRFGRLIAAWPTKLALAPLAARRIMELVGEIRRPTRTAPISLSLAADICDLPWSDPALKWSLNADAKAGRQP